jgi:hypothetical protein
LGSYGLADWIREYYHGSAALSCKLNIYREFIIIASVTINTVVLQYNYNTNINLCIACIRLYWIGPCPVQQRWRSRAQTQHEGRSRVFYF